MNTTLYSLSPLQKPLPEIFKTSKNKTLKNKQANSKVDLKANLKDYKDLNGLNILSNYKTPFINNNLSFTSKNEFTNQIKQLYTMFLFQLGKQNQKFNDDEFDFALNVYQIKESNKPQDNFNSFAQMAQDSHFETFLKQDSSYKRQVLNSRYINSALKYTDDIKTRKQYLVLLPDVLKTLDGAIKGDLSQAFFEFYLSKNKLEMTTQSHNKAIKEIEPYSYFEKEKNSKKFTSLLIKHKEYSKELIKKAFDHRIENLTEEECELLSSFIDKLLEEKKKSNTKNQTPTIEYELNTIIRIIETKKDNPKDFKTIVEILKLIKQNKIPPYALSYIAKDDRFLSDVVNRFFVEDKITEFEEKQQAQKNAPDGEVVLVGENLYYKDSSGLTKLNIDSQSFSKLFPPKTMLLMNQGENNDCYFIGAIFAILKNPKTRGRIFSMFSSDKNNIIITLPDDSCYFYPKEEVFDPKKRKEKYPFGIELLEDVFANEMMKKYNSKNKSQILEKGLQSAVFDLFFPECEKFSYLSRFELTESELKNINEANRINKTIFAIFRLRVDSIKRQIQNSTEEEKPRLQKELLELENRIKKMGEDVSVFDKAVALSNGCEIVKPTEFFDNVINTDMKNFVIGVNTSAHINNDKIKGIAKSHGYSVVNIDKQNETIDIVNPWNSAKYITLTFDEFKKCFVSACILKID